MPLSFLPLRTSWETLFDFFPCPPLTRPVLLWWTGLRGALDVLLGDVSPARLAPCLLLGYLVAACLLALRGAPATARGRGLLPA